MKRYIGTKIIKAEPMTEGIIISIEDGRFL